VLPGTTFVCGDSHTVPSEASEHLAGDSSTIASTYRDTDAAASSLALCSSNSMHITERRFCKDMILALIGRHSPPVERLRAGVRWPQFGAHRRRPAYAVQYGGRIWGENGIVAPDDATYAYLFDRPFAPSGHNWMRPSPMAIAAVRSDAVSMLNLRSMSLSWLRRLLGYESRARDWSGWECTESRFHPRDGIATVCGTGVGL